MAIGAEHYREAAEDVVSQMRDDLGVELKYDEASIEWLDGYINRIRTQLNSDGFVGLALVLGAYVGETIIRNYGGEWAYFDQTEQWGIRFDNGDGAFPIAKVYKQLEEGEFESVLSFYTILPKLRAHLNTQTPAE